MQAAAKQAAKEAGTVEEDDDAEDEGTITLVDEATMRKREVEAAMSMSLREAPTQVRVLLRALRACTELVQAALPACCEKQNSWLRHVP